MWWGNVGRVTRSPSATYTDTSCWFHQAPVRHNCSGGTCGHKELTVAQCLPSSQVDTSWAMTWACDREPAGGIPGSWILVACFFVPVLQEASALHFGVCTAAFQLLGVVGSHVRKISEDVVVDLVTWGEDRERQRRERHPQAPLTHTETYIERHDTLTRPQVQKACKHIAKHGTCTCRFTSFAAGGAGCTSSQDQPDISAGRRQRGTKVHETEDTHIKNTTKHTHHVLASSCLSSRQIASHIPLVDWGAECRHKSHNCRTK